MLIGDTYNDGFQAPANESALFRNLATMRKVVGRKKADQSARRGTQ